MPSAPALRRNITAEAALQDLRNAASSLVLRAEDEGSRDMRELASWIARLVILVDELLAEERGLAREPDTR